MTEQEKKPCGLLHDCHELRKLILENPGLPLLIFAGGGLQFRGLFLYVLLDCKRKRR